MIMNNRKTIEECCCLDKWKHRKQKDENNAKFKTAVCIGYD